MFEIIFEVVPVIEQGQELEGMPLIAQNSHQLPCQACNHHIEAHTRPPGCKGFQGQDQLHPALLLTVGWNGGQLQSLRLVIHGLPILLMHLSPNAHDFRWLHIQRRLQLPRHGLRHRIYRSEHPLGEGDGGIVAERLPEGVVFLAQPGALPLYIHLLLPAMLGVVFHGGKPPWLRGHGRSNDREAPRPDRGAEDDFWGNLSCCLCASILPEILAYSRNMYALYTWGTVLGSARMYFTYNSARCCEPHTPCCLVTTADCPPPKQERQPRHKASTSQSPRSYTGKPIPKQCPDFPCRS